MNAICCEVNAFLKCAIRQTFGFFFEIRNQKKFLLMNVTDS